MGFWPRWQYEEYVKKHSPGLAGRKLLRESSESWDDRFLNIHVGLESFPEWMSYFIVSLNDHDLNFRALVDRYQLEVRQHIEAVKPRLDQIQQRLTGLALLAETGATDWTVLIQPYRRRGVNASSGQRTSHAEAGATARHAPLDRMANPFDENYDDRVGTGRGANAIVNFTPGMWTGSALRKPGNGPDEVLFHELVHASRQMRGVQDASYVDHDYDDSEEYLAVVLSNIYLSEKGQLVLVGDHGTKPLQGVERDNFINNSQHNLLAPRQLLQDFKDSQRDFYNALANLPTSIRWNPVRQHNEFSQQHDTTRVF
jgi:Effector protein